MICPDTTTECDNPGCRRGGCQGRRPSLPLLRLCELPVATIRRPAITAAALRDQPAAFRIDVAD